MQAFDQSELKKLYVPPSSSHKGQNGKVLIVGGSHLFHAASLWALGIASKIVDMVFYASVDENSAIVHAAKEEFRNGIVVSRVDISHYAAEADCILIGPGLMRGEQEKIKVKVTELQEVENLENEGEQTYWFTKFLLEKFPHKKFVLDAGSLQMMDPQWLNNLKEMPILTPHEGEYEKLFDSEEISEIAKKYHCVVVRKGVKDIVCSPNESVEVIGGNAGMTKGGTGDVLAGLIASLYAKNEAFLAATAGSFFNKKAGESLYEKVGYYFNASDLVNEIPVIMKHYLI